MDPPALSRRAWMQWCGAALAAAGPARAHGDPPRADTIVWQPWASHAELGDAGWRRLGELARREGYARVLLQWSRFGAVDFWPTEGRCWLQDCLAHWQPLRLRLVMGLYMGPHYYRALGQSDADLQTHLTDTLARSAGQAQALVRLPPPLAVDGWYLPQEIDDLHWRQPERERMLHGFLAATRDTLAAMAPGRAQAAPIHASAFFSGASEPEAFARLLAQLHDETGVVWVVQDGLGTQRLSEARTAAYLQAIARRLPAAGWDGILEVFDTHRAEGQAPRFEPSTDATIARRQALWADATGRRPGMVFSLNQRMARHGLRG